MTLFPKEHGAYGQITFPLLAAFGVAGISSGGLLITAAVIAGFLAHEPAAIVLGQRGPRAKRELWSQAGRWLGCCLVAGVAAIIGSLLVVDPAARWSIAVPLAPACLLAVATARGRDKTWQGEVGAAVAFASAAIPVSMAAGAAFETAISIAIPFALLFVASTLAVRVVILRVRGGGDPRAAAVTRAAALTVAVGGALALGALSAIDQLAGSVLAAASPGLLLAAIIAVRPPAPIHLRRVGWSLVAVSVVTTAVVIAAV